MEQKKMLPNVYEYDEKIPFLQYSLEYVKTQTELEAKLHSCEDPAEIAMTALKTGAEFYGGDWCGIIEGDLEMEAWAPVLWYDMESDGMSETSFKELEDTKDMERWINALYECKPIIISDTKKCENIKAAESEIYDRCDAESILAVPFWKHPVGFMIVRNPTRYIDDPYESGFLQTLAYVTFSAVTEQKLASRTQNAFSPEEIHGEKDVLIKMFGGLEIYTSKGILTEAEISSPRICRFLVYLLLNNKYAVPPRRILEEIWPEEDIENAGTKIKSLAYRLQMVFGIISDNRLIISTSEGYLLNPELNIITDIKMFKDCWKRYPTILTLQTKIEVLEKALHLYRGNLYPVASSEHWIRNDEESYKSDCLEIYAEVMRIHFEAQNYASVRHYATKALEIEKANVDAYYWLIRVIRRGNSESLAKNQLKIAERILTTEEYQDLLRMLQKTRVIDI